MKKIINKSWLSSKDDEGVIFDFIDKKGKN